MVLSLCAGDGRDLIAAVRDDLNRIGRAVLVELDPKLAMQAEKAARATQLTRVEIRCQDAGAVDSYIDVLPADVLMLCGIFGNIGQRDVKNVIDDITAFLDQGRRLCHLDAGRIRTRPAS